MEEIGEKSIRNGVWMGDAYFANSFKMDGLTPEQKETLVRYHQEIYCH